MISKILETLYSKVFINIISADPQSTVYVEFVSKGEVVGSASESFKTSGINTKMLDFIKKYTKESPFYYISILDKSLNQGAVPTCKDISKYTDEKSLKTVCVDDKHSFYMKEEDLKDLKYEYQSIGLDFIFSPFSILCQFFKDKISGGVAIFLLLEENHMSLAVFNESNLLYAEYLDMTKESFSDDMLMDTIIDEDDDISIDIESIDLDDIDVDDDMGSLEDFSNIEDLDSDIDIEEFSEAQEIVQAPQQEEESEENLNDDYKRFTLIQNSINSFYHDEKYASEFVENIYIADFINVSNDLKKYLEEEMFLNVIVRKIGLAEELCEMAKMELG